MSELYDTSDTEERVVLVAVAREGEKNVNESLDELEELVATAGAVTVARVVQNRGSVHSGTYIGKGKIEELKALIYEFEADTVVCDDELTPAQIRNLEEALQAKVVDRTVIILDIFASRAQTKEGAIQVEMAQLKYRSSRLVGLRSSLSRLGGGIGTRGPGETKIEMDRRNIKDRISILSKEIEEVRRTREVARKQRQKNAVPMVSIVGYTNAGKSTLLNRLTGSNVLEEDKLFATLDPTTRSFLFEDGQQVLFSDTVGFIRKLPHHLVEAFRSTLEEVKYADVILHVVDASNPAAEGHMEVVYQTLQGLGVQDKPTITVFNKIDKVTDELKCQDPHSDGCIKISAKYNQWIPELLAMVEEKVNERFYLVEKVIPYDQAGKIQEVRKYGRLLEEEYREEGIFVRAMVPSHIQL